MGQHLLAGLRQRILRATASFAVVAALVAGCGDTTTPTATAPLSTAATVAPSDATASAQPQSGCPAFSFDPAASLGPEFQAEFFANDESEAITGGFLEALAALYAGGGVSDACEWFTASGLESAIEADGRLREITQGELRIDGDLVLRLAYTGRYDLRNRPPRLPIDAVFDIVAGATIVDTPTGASTTTTSDQRIALHIVFMFDGYRWRADRVAPISADRADWAHLPTPLPPGAPCTGFRRDPAEAAFDDASGSSGRVWCDADGQGRIVRQPDQLVLFTRYPCERGRAAVLTIGRPLGLPIDNLARYEYVRDPASEFLALGWVTNPYLGDAVPPEDAAYSGWTNGNIEIWVSPSELDQAIYIKAGGTFERWPRAARQWGFTDCN
ncbi:MAG: hypothetical protein L0227_04115 [Chloroflexi bacterium]|nr:hypothetical protein [Chloroflexota bacterium]